MVRSPFHTERTLEKNGLESKNKLNIVILTGSGFAFLHTLAAHPSCRRLILNGKSQHQIPQWSVQWAALGVGLAWVLCLLRIIRMMILLGGLAALIAYLCKK
jgi:hypothetical protein